MVSGISFLGSAGGKDERNGTSCIKVTPSVAIDAGSLLKGFKGSEPELEHIFITHSHLDHVFEIPFWIDYYYSAMRKPLNIYASSTTIRILKEKLFDGSLWPSFHEITILNSGLMTIAFHEIHHGERIYVDSDHGISIEAVDSDHCDGSLGYIIHSNDGSIYFTSDTYDTPRIWETIDNQEDIKQVVIDVSFPSRMAKLAQSSAHMTPEILLMARQKLKRQDVLIHLFHLKPNYRDETIQEIKSMGLLRPKERILDDMAFLPFDTSKLLDGVSQEPSKEQILEIIFGHVGKIAKERNLEHLLLLMADMARQIVLADRCTIWMIDEENGELWSKVAHGIATIRIPSNKGIAGHVAQSGEVLIINDPYNDERFNPEIDRKTGYRTHSIIALPIFNSEGKIIGVYQVINKISLTQSFSQEDARYLTLAATYTGSALETAMLYTEIEETQKEIIYTMAEIGETRSQETGYHVKRVAEYSQILALGMGLSQTESELVKIAAPMHDIGKIAIPDMILNKPGRLTPEEFEIMKTHARLGYETLKHSQRRILKAAATIAYEHHEKWNGSGYPQGKAGEDIHIYGRIVALADVFDALGSDRCYKKAWKLDDICELFRNERGEHFDPKVVDAFFENLPKILEVRDKYRDV
ncbi:MAG: HD domain-containing phosphohydrolase [Wolinella sp.]